MNRSTENAEDHDIAAEPMGCLAWILGVLGIFIQRPDAEVDEQTLAYRLSQRFLSPAELSFYQVLKRVLPQEYTICVKPRLGDLLFVPRGASGRWALQNKIQSKHVDFLICDELTMTPQLVLELDDKSHNRPDRKDRDAFVDKALAAARIEIIHVTARAAYAPDEVRSAVLKALSKSQRPSPPPLQVGTTPICPTCGVPLIKRLATRGAHKGTEFWGCQNYPNCRARSPM